MCIRDSNNTVDWGTREDQEQTTQEIEQRDMVDAAEILEQPVEIAGDVVEERAPVQEPRRSGRARKTNMKYNPDVWDLERD